MTSYQFFWKVCIVFQCSPKLLDRLLEAMKISLWFEIVQHRRVPTDSIMKTRNTIQIHVILSSRDGSQVNKHLQLIDV